MTARNEHNFTAEGSGDVGIIAISKNTSAGWPGPIYFLQEENGPRFGECYLLEKATMVSHQRFTELKEKRIIPKDAEYIPGASKK